jgi:hypothetical protein
MAAYITPLGSAGSRTATGERNGQYRHGERNKADNCGAAEIQRFAENAPRRLM